MRALIIGPEEKEKLKAAYERARAKPIPWETLKALMSPVQNVPVLTLDNRSEAARAQERPRSECVEIPMGYQVCVSFEDQPAGLLAHVSISVSTPGMLPNENAVNMILDEFGYHVSQADSGWVEEFMFNGKPGGLAVNLVFMIEPRKQQGGVQ